MISITIIPEKFRLEQLTIGDVAVEYDVFLDRFSLNGIVSTTNEQLDELVEPNLIAVFYDMEGSLLYTGRLTLHGIFTEFGFCSFSINIMNVSSVMEVEKIAEIRLTPT